MRTLALLAALAVATPAAAQLAVPCGGVLIANPLRSWKLTSPSQSVPFEINSTVVPPGGGLTRAEIEAATIAAAEGWNGIRAGLADATVFPCTRGFVLDGHNCISYEDAQNSLGGSTLAATVVSWVSSGTHSCTTPDLGPRTFNDYVETDVVFNDGVPWTLPAAPGSNACRSGCATHPPNLAKWDLQAVGLHEVGHAIGLDHSANSTDTMFASFGPCDCTKSNLNPCDVQAASILCYAATGCE